MKRFAGRIKETRRALGMTQTQLAREAGVSLATVQSVEAAAANPSLATLKGILEALGLSLRTEPSGVDWDALIAHGLPLHPIGPSRHRPTSPTLRRLLRSAAVALSRSEATPDRSRLAESYEALLLALHTHYPSTWKAWFGRSPLVASHLPAEPTGRHLKLRRLALAALGGYL